MARKKKEECKTVPAWLTSFSDLMSLLLTFFILLYSMSTLDITKAMKFLSYFQGEKAKSFKISIVKPIKIYTTDVAKKIKKILRRMLPIYGYQIVVTENYVLVRLFNKVLFKENSFELTPEVKKALDQIAEVIKSLPNCQIKVVGHTSYGEPTKVIPGIQDSWDLSIRRATTVAKYLISKGVPPDKVEAVGYDYTRPLYTWRNPLLQARNRRVEIFIYLAQPRKEEGKVELKRKEKLPPQKKANP